MASPTVTAPTHPHAHTLAAGVTLVMASASRSVQDVLQRLLQGSMFEGLDCVRRIPHERYAQAQGTCCARTVAQP